MGATHRYSPGTDPTGTRHGCRRRDPQPLQLGKAPRTHSAPTQGFGLIERTNQEVFMMSALPSVQEGSGTSCFQAAPVPQRRQLRVTVLLLSLEQRVPKDRDCTFTNRFTPSPALGSPEAPLLRLFGNCCYEGGTLKPHLISASPCFNQWRSDVQLSLNPAVPGQLMCANIKASLM